MCKRGFGLNGFRSLVPACHRSACRCDFRLGPETTVCGYRGAVRETGAEQHALRAHPAAWVAWRLCLSSTPVQVHLERTERQLTGADQALGWTATGDVEGAPFALVGITARVGGSVIALVGWDPTTNATYVPAATQMFVDGF